ncbi:MAG: TetR/AcrR family transcriptional regulator [Deltaproteobacteria bacterium]|nr:TetR/AcrR family transcriptional regulator [Deltaproteobacteria bacterium]
MVRPREFELEEVSEGLLNAFWLRGFARTSIPDLTAATGLLPGSLYAAFGSKEDMFRVAVERYVAQLRAAISNGVRGLAGVQDVLDTVVRLTASDPERRGCLILNTIPESSSLSAPTRRQLQSGLRAMRRFVRDRLREAQDDVGTSVDLDPLAALVFAAAVAIRVLGRAGLDRRLLQDIADGATAAVRRALEHG